MPYYKTPLPGPITILCAGRTEGVWHVFGQEPTGREAVYEWSRLTWEVRRSQRGGRRGSWFIFSPFYWQLPPTGLKSWQTRSKWAQILVWIRRKNIKSWQTCPTQTWNSRKHRPPPPLGLLWVSCSQLGIPRHDLHCASWFLEKTKLEENLQFPMLIPSPMSDRKSRVVWGLHCLRLSTVWSPKHPGQALKILSLILPPIWRPFDPSLLCPGIKSGCHPVGGTKTAIYYKYRLGFKEGGPKKKREKYVFLLNPRSPPAPLTPIFSFRSTTTNGKN